MNIITHRKGSTYELQCQYTDAIGNSVPLDGISIKSQVRDKLSNLISDCIVLNIVPAAGSFTLRVLDTSMWPITMLLQDIQYTLSDGRVISTNTITINVVGAITQ